MNSLKNIIITYSVRSQQTVWSFVIAIGEDSGVFSATISGSCDISIPVREIFDCDPVLFNTN